MRRWISIFLVFFSPLLSAGTAQIPDWDLASLKMHIQAKFAQAAVFTEPYPHIYVENVLPDDVYDLLSEHWPEEELIQRTIQPRSGTWRRALSPGEEAWVNDPSRLIWRKFAEEVVNPIIKLEVSKILRSYLFHRFSADKINKVQLCHPNNLYDHLLIQDFGYVWFPHIDQAARFAALLFYFPRKEDLSHEHMGTYVFKHKSGLESIDVIGAAPEDVETVRVMSYRPNSLFIIMQTPRSWHGPVFTDETGYLRRVYLSAIFLTPDCMGKIYNTIYQEDLGDKNISQQKGDSHPY